MMPGKQGRRAGKSGGGCSLQDALLIRGVSRSQSRGHCCPLATFRAGVQHLAVTSSLTPSTPAPNPTLRLVGFNLLGPGPPVPLLLTPLGPQARVGVGQPTDQHPALLLSEPELERG